MSRRVRARAQRGGFPSFIDIGNILKRGDLALAFGILTILVVLILPLPSIVLDLFSGDLDHRCRS